MAQPGFRCHGCARAFHHRSGADLHCSKECEERHRADQQAMESALKNAGFHQLKEIPNLWERDGVHLSIEQVMRNGFDQSLAEHRRAIKERF
jgi:hypothetical protein